MPMPALDPTRFIAAVLADPSHELPLPDRGGRRFLAEGETVDSWDPFYAHLLADGSLKPKPAEVVDLVVEHGGTTHVDAIGTTTVLDHRSGIVTSVDSSGVQVAPTPAVVEALVSATAAAGIVTPDAVPRAPEAAEATADASTPTAPAVAPADPAH